ncbi:hypothetical protein TNCT_357871 [Trichonephila clavata]|uniref:Uncharacterized protein n=1 Tax=Trichonephila clavata TaxID=2740835 RepID=A0A8X6FJS6_TRICU|nr:hypothetical protein TNCT_357871 [Trichonephila clavata]
MLWLVPIKQLLGMVDLKWEVGHNVSEYFSNGAVRIDCLLRNYTRATAPKLSCQCFNSCLVSSTSIGATLLRSLPG